MVVYKANCRFGYSLMGESPPELDMGALYVILAKSRYYKYCVVIKRVDGKKYLGNDTWIVPERYLELVSV